MLFLNPLRVLSTLRGFILLTAEHAETAKDSVRTFSTKLFPLTLCALSALCGSIFSLTAEPAETAKELETTFILTLFLITLRALGVLRGSISLTAELAEDAKIFVKITCSTFPVRLRVLSVLRGSIFNNWYIYRLL